MHRSLSLPLLLLFCSTFSLRGQDGPPPFVMKAVQALEAYLGSEGEEATRQFIAEAMVAKTLNNQEDWVGKLESLRRELRNCLDDISLAPDPDGFRMNLSGPGGDKRLRVIMDRTEKKIVDLEVGEAPRPMQLSLENLSATFDSLATVGYSGLLYLKIGDEFELKKPFGMAISSKNHLNTQP